MDEASRRVAIVDDDKLTLSMLGDALLAAGYQVRTFGNGEDALGALWEDGVDLAVVDLVLPKMNGLRLAHELRLRPWASGLSIVLASAVELGGDEVIEHLTSGLVDAVLRKPFAPADLLKLAAELIESKAESATPPPPASLPQPAAPASAADGGPLKVDLQAARDYIVEYSDNLALGGLFVRTLDPLPAGAEVSVSLTLPFRYRTGEVTLRGRVERSVPADSPGARVGHAGMAIALLDVPEELKLAMDAYVTGFRAGCAANAPPAQPARVLLVGLQSLLPGDVQSFLRRAGVICARCASLAEAPAWIARLKPKLVVVEGAQLGSDPRGTLAPLLAVRQKVLVVAPEEIEGLADVVTFLDPGEPLRLLDQISAAVEQVQRRATRVPLRVPVVCRRPEGSLKGMLENVSMTGVSMLLEGDCAVGERLAMAFDLPGLAEGVRAQVEVLRVGRAAGEPPMVRVGAAFAGLESGSTEPLRRFVATRSGLRAYVRYTKGDEQS